MDLPAPRSITIYESTNPISFSAAWTAWAFPLNPQPPQMDTLTFLSESILKRQFVSNGIEKNFNDKKDSNHPKLTSKELFSTLSISLHRFRRVYYQ
jgi:hypothetical protein